MKIPVVDLSGKEVGSQELPESIFGARINRGLMHQALVRQMANGRSGTHKTKGRSEVRYSTRKIYRQKGTGNARHGSRRAPIFVGGGIAHGVTPRDYSKKMPRKMRHAALRSALSVKARSGEIVLLKKLELDAPKTKEMVAVQNSICDGDDALVLLAGANENVELSARNISNVKAIRADYMNIRDLLGHTKLVLPLDALERITALLGEEEA